MALTVTIRFDVSCWRNVRSASVHADDVAVIHGPMGSGKTNLLDALWFVRDVAVIGLAGALQRRSGMESITPMWEPKSVTSVAVELSPWLYRLSIGPDRRIVSELVFRDGATVIERPDAQDRADPERLTQSILWQSTANSAVRGLISQLTALRRFGYDAADGGRLRVPEDVLERMADVRSRAPKRFDAMWEKLVVLVRDVAPWLGAMQLVRDESGRTRLRVWVGRKCHTESQLSDGTVRLLCLVLEMLDGAGPLIVDDDDVGLSEEAWSAVLELAPKLGRQLLFCTRSRSLLSTVPRESTFFMAPSSSGSAVSWQQP